MKKFISTIFILLSIGVIIYLLVRPQGVGGIIPDISDWETVHDGQNYSILMDPETGKWVFLIPMVEDTIINGPYNGKPPTREQREYLIYEEQTEDGTTDKFVYVLENTDTTTGKCVIRIFDEEGNLLKTHIRQGECITSVVDPETERKAVISKEGNTVEIFLFDYPEGNSLGAAYLPYDSLETIPDVELLGDKIVVIVQREDSFYVFINFFRNTQFQDRFTMPGKFVNAIANDEDLKFIITEGVNGAYGDVFIIEDSLRNHHIQSGGAIPGETSDVQMHQIGNEWRILHSIYNPINKTTTVRVYDQEGRILKAHIFQGKFHKAKEFPDTLAIRKVYFTEHPPYDEQVDKTNIYVIDFQSGDQILTNGSMPGRYKTHSVSGNQLKVTTNFAGQDLEQIFVLQ